MSNRYLSGAYPGGYTLNAKYSGLVIKAAASVGGTGVSAAFNTTIQNFGAVNATASGASGLYLAVGGGVVNGSATDTTALIAGYNGVKVEGAGATIANFGTIQGMTGYSAADSIVLAAGGTVTNGSAIDTTALIAGNGVNASSFYASATIVNYGAIQGFGFGVDLVAGGTVTNGSGADTKALIAGDDGVVVGNAPAKVTNFGTIQGVFRGGAGVNLAGGGTVTNGSAADTAALIEGGYSGVVLRYEVATITNFGAIRGQGVGYGAAAVDLSSGSVTNGSATDTTALIAGYNGVRSSGVFAAPTIVNFGTIQGVGAYGEGVLLTESGSVTNGSATDTRALIESSVGVYCKGPLATVTNFGTISGSRGTAVRFNFANDVLVVEAGCAFVGAVLGGGGTLDLASGVGTLTGNLAGGTVTVSGSMATTPFSNFGTVEIGSGARFTTSGAVSIAAGQKLIDVGALTLAGAIANAGEIGLVSLGAAASLTIGAAGATLSGGGRFILDDSALNLITGAGPAATLTNIDNTLSGAGRLGGGSLTLVNGAKGVIVGSLSLALIIDTGSNTIVNAGRIVAKGAGGVTIASAIANSGVLEAAGGVLTVNGAVSGTGTGVVDGGRLDFASSFNQKVVFQTAGGVLELDRSQSYAGSITGFSKTGATSLDLRDIAFKSAGEATFSGTATTGVLTVTDGTHTARITLIGDYRISTFTASSDGHGGVVVVDPATVAAPKTPSVHPIVAAMASLGAGGASPEHRAAFGFHAVPTLIGPRTLIA